MQMYASISREENLRPHAWSRCLVFHHSSDYSAETSRPSPRWDTDEAAVQLEEDMLRLERSGESPIWGQWFSFRGLDYAQHILSVRLVSHLNILSIYSHVSPDLLALIALLQSLPNTENDIQHSRSLFDLGLKLQNIVGNHHCPTPWLIYRSVLFPTGIEGPGSPNHN